jgi:hypothetical protein
VLDVRVLALPDDDLLTLGPVDDADEELEGRSPFKSLSARTAPFLDWPAGVRGPGKGGIVASPSIRTLASLNVWVRRSGVVSRVDDAPSY